MSDKIRRKHPSTLFVFVLHMRMYRFIAGVILITMSCIRLMAAEYIVPERMTFCGIELHINAAARAEIAKTVHKLTYKPEYLQELQRRTDIFMPWVEDALKRSGVPEDLKYLVIQESAFVGDAVSSSNAVGFWQFKDFTGREMGLVINEQIDERKHIYRSTLAAAKYFYQNNRVFDNYLYAVIAYYAGGGGSMPYIDPAMFGARKMQITETFHWYPLKALAHKIVFEEYIRSGKTPSVWLETKLVEPGRKIDDLCREFQVHPDSFRKYNLWALKSQLPDINRPLVCFIPGIPEGSVQGKPLHNGLLPEIKPGFAGPEIPVPAQIQLEGGKQNSTEIAKQNMLWDEDFRREYIFTERSLSIEQAAASRGIQVSDFRKWNPGLNTLNHMQAGSWARVTDPESAEIWIAGDGDSWEQIAFVCGIEAEKLQRMNRIKKAGEEIIPGRKILLRKKLPRREKIIQLLPPEKNKTGNSTVLSFHFPDPHTLPGDLSDAPVVCQPEGKSVVCKVIIPESVKPLPSVKGEWLTHEVRKGEQIWMLAKKYDTRGDLIQKINHLNSSKIRAGMKLKVFFVETI